MKIVNLTPHTINIKINDKTLSVAPSGEVARVATIEKVIGEVDGIPIVERTFGDVEGLPAPQKDTIYLVSSMVLAAVKERDDVFAPDTGASAIRDEAGRIVAVTRLVKA